MARRKTTKRRGALSSSHQKCWLWGRRLVTETLRAGAWPVIELHLADDLDEDEMEVARASAARSRAKTSIEPRQRLTELCHVHEHQGYLAKMSAFPYAGAGELLGDPGALSLCVILDAIHDPHNFGAIVRSAEVFGAGAVFVGTRGQSEVTTAVARASAGAVNRVAIAEADDLVELVERLKGAGVSVVAATPHGGRDACDVDLAGPCAIVIGNEARGVGDDLLACCWARVRIPQHGRIGSLNAAASAAVLFYEAQRQRRTKAPP